MPLTLLAVPASATALEGMRTAEACAVEELPLPSGWSDVDVVAGDATGQYLVGNDDRESVLWADGEVEVVRSPGNYPLTHDVNSSGVAVGRAFDPDAATDGAFVHTERADRWLAPPETTEYSEYAATGINDAGDIVGFYTTDDGRYQPVLWPADTPDQIEELYTTGSSGSVQPMDISDDGVVVGRELDGDANHVFVWSDASIDGSRLESPFGSDQVRAYEISGDWVAGREGTGENAVGVLWNLADGSSTTLPEPLSAVNSDGDASTPGENATLFRADGTEIELPALSDTSIGRSTHVAFDSGAPYVAAGSDRDADGTDHPVVWTDC